MVDSTYVRIPCDISAPLETLEVDLSKAVEGKDAGDLLPKHLEKYIDTQNYKVETTPLKRMAPFNPNMFVKEEANIQSGVYAYTFSSTTGSELHRLEPNVRATCVSMACGLHGQKFSGDVYIARLGYVSDGKGEHKLTNPPFTENEIVFACQSPDLRVDIIKSLNGDFSDIDISLPLWLVEAAKINYEDAAALAVLAKVMKTDKQLDNNMKQENSGLSEGSTVGESGYESDTDNKDNGKDDVLTSNARENAEESSAGESGYESDTDDKDNGKGDVLTSNARENVEKRSAGESGYESDNDNNDNGKHDDSTANIKADLKPTFVTKQSLCLHCRRPSDNLCPGCDAAYFCKAPRPCQTVGWSHQAICKTWALYSERRDMLGSFPFEGWHHPLVSRENQISEEPYQKYLMNELGVLKTGEEATWWTTEISGWCGGQSDSAKEIDFIRRLTYEKGFALDSNLVPPERNITSEDLKVAGISREPQCNLLQLNDWGDYYKLRGIPLQSPAALLLTFPLTMHYALLKHGAVPITVAKMLHRQLRIHVIGIEKELNFLDLFKELGFLLPDDLNVSYIMTSTRF